MSAPSDASSSTDQRDLGVSAPGYHESSQFLGHPLGLFLLFLVEMWERFSYYGMRALLVLYLTAKTDVPNPGRGWSEADASTLYGWYTGLAYLFPIFGGLIADKFIGTHRSMLVGGALIALGHVVLGFSGIGELAANQAGLSMFVCGLALIVLGTGHFKPTVSVMVGQLYSHNDPRRDGAYTIFYMGINLGAFLCAFVCGSLGESEDWGWHWGFGAAAVGMVLGMLLYLWGRPRHLSGIGEAPQANASSKAWSFFGVSLLLSLGFGQLHYSGSLGRAMSMLDSALQNNPMWGWVISLSLLAAVIVWAVRFVLRNEVSDRGPVITILVFMLFNALFWLAFEQAGSSINVFTSESTARTLNWLQVQGKPFEVPATWFQSINAFLIFVMAPLFSWIWTRLAAWKMNPSQPMKISLGLACIAVGYMFTVAAGMAASGGDQKKASMWLIVATYFWHTVGELCVSPTGLSYVTRTAPPKYVSLLMGLWFVSSFIANLAGGMIAAKVTAVEEGQIALPWKFGGRADFFFLFVVTSTVASLTILLLTPLLKRMMRPDET